MPAPLHYQGQQRQGAGPPYQGVPRGANPNHGGPRGANQQLHRPYSFTHGVIPEVEFSEALGAQLGTLYFLYRGWGSRLFYHGSGSSFHF